VVNAVGETWRTVCGCTLVAEHYTETGNIQNTVLLFKIIDSLKTIAQY